MLAKFLIRYERRRWIYATSELLTFGLAVFSAIILFNRKSWTPVVGMSPMTALCVGLLSLTVFVLLMVVREQDVKDKDD